MDGWECFDQRTSHVELEIKQLDGVFEIQVQDINLYISHGQSLFRKDKRKRSLKQKSTEAGRIVTDQGIIYLQLQINMN